MPAVSPKRAALLAFCRSLPLATEDVKWGADLVFSVGKKMFCVFSKDGTDATFGCKVPEDEFAAITSVEGIEPAAYAARYHWVSVRDPAVLPLAEAKRMICGSYDLVAAGLSKKLQAAIAEGTPAQTKRPAAATKKKTKAGSKTKPKKR